MTTHVICWGGGPDSTYLLKRTLEETSDPVVAICVIGDHLNHHAVNACRTAVRRLNNALQLIREFELVEVVLTASPQGYGEDQCHTFATMMVAGRYPDAEVWWARNESDTHPEFDINELVNPESVAEAARLIRLICPLHKVGYDITKRKIRKELGWMWYETVSCENWKRTREPCGDCGKCREREEAEQEVGEDA